MAADPGLIEHRPDATPLRAAPVLNPPLLVHHSLRIPLAMHISEFQSQGLSIQALDRPADELDPDRPSAVALPATNTGRLDLITQVGQDYPFAAVVAAVIDPTGLISLSAIEAGASLVLNLLIPPEHAVPVIAQQLLAHLNYGGIDGLFAARDSTPRWSSDCSLSTVLPATDSDHQLLHLLMSGQSTSQLARRFYCSERSMYRRLRNVYDRIGVSGRYELMNRMADRAG